MVQNSPSWTASLLLFPRWEIQNKETSSLTGESRFVLEAVTFFCVPVWRILYHVIVCCKRPITTYYLKPNLKPAGVRVIPHNCIAHPY